MLVANSTSTLIRPNNTTGYASGQLIASSTTPGSVALSSFSYSPAQPQVGITRLRMYTNVTTGWGGAVLRVRLWTAPPVYTNGDGGAYAITSGARNILYYAGFDITMVQLGDGAVGEAIPNAGTCVYVGGPSPIYWDCVLQSAAGMTPIGNQIFVLTPEMVG